MRTEKKKENAAAVIENEKAKMQEVPKGSG